MFNKHEWKIKHFRNLSREVIRIIFMDEEENIQEYYDWNDIFDYFTHK